MIKNNKNIAGASLIEILIAMVLVAITLVAIASTFPKISSHGRAMTESDQARVLAMEVLDGLQQVTRNQGCNDTHIGTFLTQNVGPLLSTNGNINRYGSIDLGAVSYDVSVQTDCSGAGAFNTVNITVSWTKSGKNHNITITGVLR